MLRVLKFVLTPFAILYGIVTEFRNWAYDNGFLYAAKFDFPIIGVGNLTTGGTGKTPFTFFLMNHLKSKHVIASLSRGYGRSTKGYQEVSLAQDVNYFGDEAYLTKMKENELQVVVCEKRILGVQKILQDHPSTNLILMDDGFQHRSLIPSLSIILTTFQAPFYDDYLLPIGNLRERRKHIKRAKIVVVTKCPKDISAEEMKKREKKIASYGNFKKIYFARIAYDIPYSLLNSNEKVDLNSLTELTLVTGIADNGELISYVSNVVERIELFEYADHHDYTIENLTKINAHLSKTSGQKKVILTTEKDAVKLRQFKKYFVQENITVLVLPISIEFIGVHKEEVIASIEEEL